MPACGNDSCGISSGICGAITYGSGEQDDNGYWDVPCSVCSLTASLRPVRKGATKYDVWPEPPPSLTFLQMVSILDLPLGTDPLGRHEDPVVLQERARLYKSYKEIRTTDDNNPSDKVVLNDIGDCMNLARASWLKEHLMFRDVRRRARVRRVKRRAKSKASPPAPLRRV